MRLIAKYKQFKQNRLEKAIAKNQKLIVNPKAIREDRVAAIDFFCAQEEASIAVPALLQRFNFSLEHGINDTREKESAMEGIVGFAEKAIPFITEHLRHSDRIAWPIKALKALASQDEEIVTTLASCLDFGDVALDQRKVDKNYDILCYLHDYKLPSSLLQQLLHFIDAADERVRFAAVETLIEQADASIAAKLEPFLQDDSAENTRVRQSVISAFLKNKWTISDRKRFNEGPLTEQVIVNRQFQLEAH